ncbi:hypothetical protein M758_1G252500 [Ceratodon purpureus]|nr:hypothetical protein M758_1G252500 [Ceratodon purpureus]
MDPGLVVPITLPQGFKDFVHGEISRESLSSGHKATNESNILMTKDEMIKQRMRSKLQISEWSMHVCEELSQYFPTIRWDENFIEKSEGQEKRAKLRGKLNCKEGEEFETGREIFKTIEDGHLEGQAKKFEELMKAKVKDWNFQLEEYGNTSPLLWAILNGQRKIVQIIRDHAMAHGHTRSMFQTTDKFGFKIMNLLVFSFLILPSSRYSEAKGIIKDLMHGHYGWEYESNTQLGYMNSDFAKTVPPCKIYYLIGDTSYYVDDLGHLGNYMTPLHLSVWFAPLQVAKEFIRMRIQELHIATGRGHTIFHLAAWKGRYDILEWVDRYTRYLNISMDVANRSDFDRQSPLHLAVISQNLECIKIFLRAEVLKVNLRNKKGYTPMEIAIALNASSQSIISKDDLMLYGVTSFDTKSLGYNLESFDVNNLGIMKFLENDMPLTGLTKRTIIIEEIISAIDGLDPETLQRDREVYVQAASAILVVAALIASGSFTAWLQPPLGYIPYYSSEFLVTEGAAPPGTYESFVSIKQHYVIHIFWIFNSLSFFSSIATIVAGVDASLPRKNLALKEAVTNMRQKVIFSSYLLFLALLLLIGSFITIGFAVLPPVLKYRINMFCTVAIGLVICGVALTRFFRKLERS